jgi:hypothetical protein
MGSFGTVTIREIWAMLAHCAPGFTYKRTDHHYRVCFGESVYPALPLGAHGRGENAEIQKGHVKKMARSLGILDCAKAALSL